MDKLRSPFFETCQITFNGVTTTIPTGQEGTVDGKKFIIQAEATYANDIVGILANTGESATLNNLTDKVTPITLQYGLGIAGFNSETIKEVMAGNLTIEHLP